jgi:membrane protein implicated in regulation of membrane protease activity
MLVLGINLYVLITLVCGLLMIAMFFMGDFGGDMDVDVDVDMDMGHIELGHGDVQAGMSPLSLPILLSFGTSFGAFGFIFEQFIENAYIVPLLSILISSVIAGVMYLLVLNIFVRTQTSSDIRLDRLIGEDAIVSIPIKTGSIGQIIVTTEERGRTILSAVSDEDITTDSLVKITKIMGDGVFVKKIQIKDKEE